jgi:hypothetical protein
MLAFAFDFEENNYKISYIIGWLIITLMLIDFGLNITLVIKDIVLKAYIKIKKFIIMRKNRRNKIIPSIKINNFIE